MADRAKMRRHAEVHLNMNHPCIACGKNFKTRNALSIHYTRYHGQEVESPWTNREQIYPSFLYRTLQVYLFSKPMYHSRLKKISLHVGTGRIRVKNGIEEGQSFSSDVTNFSVKFFLTEIHNFDNKI